MTINKGDNFFKAEEGILSTYEIDYDASVEFETQLGQRNTLLICSVVPYFWPCLPFGACFVNSSTFHQDVNDAVRAQHLAITVDGIKYVTDGHKSGCRFDCQDKGKVSKTIPFDKITDCDIQEPAGSTGPCCCMVKNVLTLVNIDTASGSRGAGGGHELTIKGLKDPHKFKKDVWAMKRGEGIDGVLPSPPSVASAAPSLSMDRSGMEMNFQNKYAAPASNSDMVPLMVEQNKLLKEQNGILQKILNK